jgi:pyrroline-5-carboxylate reductase
MNWSEQGVAVIGCGVMAQCLVDGWLKNSIFQADKMTLTDALAPGLAALKNKYSKSTITANNVEAIEASQIIFICVKPFMVESVLRSVLKDSPGAFKNKILISVAAGLKLSLYHEILKDSGFSAIFRAMPNIASRVDAGMTAVCGSSLVDSIRCDQNLLESTKEIFEALGGWTSVEDEKLMDVVTALNGSALAFGCLAIEAMADGAVSMGLPRALAISLSSHALRAASSLQISTGDHPAVLRDQITTPGGCTIAGLLALEEGNFRSTLAKAVQETTRISKQLGEKK